MAKDSKMYHISSDIQKIQVKTNMYINEYGEEGAFHLAREIIQNNFDECLDEDSDGNKIEISYDIATDILRSEDNGRGFNESVYPMSVFCTTLQSGSKFFRETGAASAGEFGVGLSVVNALSDIFILTSNREYEKTSHTLEFHEGVLEKDYKKANSKGKHGTVVSFRASKKYMGDNVRMPIDKLVAWIESLFYLNSDALKRKGITSTVTIYDGMELKNTYKLKPKPFYELLDIIIPANLKKKDLSDVTYFSGGTKFMENTKKLIEDENGEASVEMVEEEKEIIMDIAFLYTTSIEMNERATFNTYCNCTNTIENGSHLLAFDEAYCRFMQNKVNASMSEGQRDKLKITWDDIRTNLFCTINLSSNAYVGFVGNAKQKINCTDLIPYMKDVVTLGLENFFSNNQNILNDYIKIIKLNAKARLEAQKAKTATQTERLNALKEHEMKNLIRCNNTGKNQFKEIN